MRDYIVIRSDGSSTSVAEMPTAEILDLLANGFTALPGSQVAPDAMRERMRLEIMIRELGL